MSVHDKIEVGKRVLSLDAPADASQRPAFFRWLRSGRRPNPIDFIWLIYTIWFFTEPIARHNRHDWLFFAVFYTVFLAFYCGLIFFRQRWQSYACLVAITVLGAVYFPFNSGAGGCFIYAAAFLPFVVESLSISLGCIVLLAISVAVEGRLLYTSPWVWGFGAIITLVVGIGNVAISQRIRTNAKLQLAHEEIEQLAKLAERERIARDLHDVLGHTLSVIVLKSELAGRLFAHDPQRAAAEIADVERISRKALSEVREAIGGYRAEGLVAEIERARSVLDVAGVALVCEEKPPSPLLSAAEETVLSLALREAVTNIVRHAQASRCVMRFVIEDGKSRLIVEDDGRGCSRTEGNGLRGMRERIEALGGNFAIDGTQGTRLTIELPANG